MKKGAGQKHKNEIVEQFTKQAVPFAKLPGHLDSMQMLIEMSGVVNNDTVLDVACGPGLVACEFANHAHKVTGIDITDEMIEQANKLQHEKNLKNLSWDVGDAIPLPYADDAFSIVITRYSFHHFLEPREVLSEMIRVCKPGGIVMVVDVVLPPEKVDAYNKMEKLRDPSHIRALTNNEFEMMFHELGLENCRQGQYRVEMVLEAQLKASFPNPGDDEKIRAILSEDLGIDNLGVGAKKGENDIHFAYPISIYVGQKPS